MLKWCLKHKQPSLMFREVDQDATKKQLSDLAAPGWIMVHILFSCFGQLFNIVQPSAGWYLSDMSPQLGVGCQALWKPLPGWAMEKWALEFRSDVPRTELYIYIYYIHINLHRITWVYSWSWGVNFAALTGSEVHEECWLDNSSCCAWLQCV